MDVEQLKKIIESNWEKIDEINIDKSNLKGEFTLLIQGKERKTKITIQTTTEAQIKKLLKKFFYSFKSFSKEHISKTPTRLPLCLKGYRITSCSPISTIRFTRSKSSSVSCISFKNTGLFTWERNSIIA